MVWVLPSQQRTEFVMTDGVQSDVKDLQFGVPQRSVLEPILYSLCISPWAILWRRHHGLKFHLYANNTQLYFAFRPATAEQQSSLVRIEACASHIDSWLVQKQLKLNTGKTELLILNASYRPHPTIETTQVFNVPLGTSESSLIKKWLLSNTSLPYATLVFFILGI